MICKNATVKYLINGASGAEVTTLNARGFQIDKGVVPSRPFEGLALEPGVCTNDDFKRVRIVLTEGAHTDLEAISNSTVVSFQVDNGVFVYNFNGTLKAHKPLTYKYFDESTNTETDIDCYYLDFVVEDEVEVTAHA